MQIEAITQSQVVEKLLSDPRISRLTNDDILLIKSQSSESKPGGSYADAWCYLTQAAHMEDCNARLGLRFSDEKTIIVLGVFRRPVDPERQHVHLIRPSGHWNPAVVRELAQFAHSITRTPVYVKKIDGVQFESLKSIGFFDVMKYPWHDLAHAEDDTFSELVISLDILERSLNNGRDTEIRRKYRKFQRLHGSRISFLDYEVQAESDAQDIVDGFFSSRYPVHGWISDPNDYLNMIKLCRLVDKKDFGIYSWLVHLDDSPIGFFVAERTSHRVTCGVYTSIVLHQDLGDVGQGISEFVWTNCLLKLREAGFKFANLGGSETQGLHSFKNKFVRVADGQPCQMSWAVWTEDLPDSNLQNCPQDLVSAIDDTAESDSAIKPVKGVKETFTIEEGPKVQAVLILINVIMGISLWQALVAIQADKDPKTVNTFAMWGAFALVLVNLLRTFLGFVSFEMNKGLAEVLTRRVWTSIVEKEGKAILQTFRLADFIMGMTAATLLVPLSQCCGEPVSFVKWFFAVSLVFVVRNTALTIFYNITIKLAVVQVKESAYQGDLIVNPLIANLEMAKFWLKIDGTIMFGAILMMVSLNKVPEIFGVGAVLALAVMFFEMWYKRRYYFASGTLDKSALPDE